MITTPDLRRVSLADRLLQHGDRPALLGDGLVVSHAELARRVGEVSASYAGERRLVLLTPTNDVDSVVEYLGALAADQVVLLCAPESRETLVESYDPDVVADAAGREWRREASAHTLHPELSLLLSTSGSTGSPKLARLSDDALLANATAIADRLGIRTDDVAGLTLPLHYCYGLSVLHSHLMRGAAVLLSDASVLDEGFWAGARDITTLAGVPHTFDLLDRSGFADRELPRLRYLTQAGGRMPPERVRAWAELGRERGWDFVVMYGQTEATARMSVLPPACTSTAPESIGLPLDNVEFSLAPVGHPDPEVGELVCQGPAVMLGYATSPPDLALGRTVTALHTGDLARRREDGLWEIVGRRSRFAKVCGLRVDLDHLERTLARKGYVVAAADADDRVVLAVATGSRGIDPFELHAAGIRACALAPASVEVLPLEDLPRTERGKVDYPEVVRLSGAPEVAPTGAGVHDVTALYARLLGRPDARATDSFVSLGGDSLSYVEVSLQLESVLGHLPADWPQLSAAALADTPSQPARRGALVESNVVMRALAIVAIVGTHANLFTLLGGAHLLLAVAGFNLARFQLTDVPRRQRVRGMLTSAVRIAIPSMAVIAVFSVVGMWADGLGWRQVLLVNGLTSTTWSEPGWYFWFIEALVHTLLLLAVLLAMPRVDAWERARPFAFPMVLVGFAMLTRYEILDVAGDGIHRGQVVFWLFALGWAAARARTSWQRMVVSAVAVATLVGAFDQAGRDLFVAVGLLVLVWVPHMRLPRVLVRPVGVLAAASLWIYLTHWQVYPRWEDTYPLFATLASLAVGVGIAWLTPRLTGQLSAPLREGARRVLGNR